MGPLAGNARRMLFRLYRLVRHSEPELHHRPVPRPLRVWLLGHGIDVAPPRPLRSQPSRRNRRDAREAISCGRLRCVSGLHPGAAAAAEGTLPYPRTSWSPAALPDVTFHRAMRRLLTVALLLASAFAGDNLKLNPKLDYDSDSLDGPLVSGDRLAESIVAGKPNYVLIVGEG